MNRNGRSQWHGGGTRPPSRGERGGSASGIGLQRPAGAVPYRATSGARLREKDPIRRCSEGTHGRSGTVWHACPHVSARDRGRA
jgi:hypothetical protein